MPTETAGELLTSPGSAVGTVADSPTMNSWIRCFLSDAHHLLGEYSAEVEVAREGRQKFPTMIGFHAKEARALVALGRLADAERTVDESLAVQRVAGAPVGTEF